VYQSGRGNISRETEDIRREEETWLLEFVLDVTVIDCPSSFFLCNRGREVAPRAKRSGKKGAKPHHDGLSDSTALLLQRL
jgi:hypothetical protein